MWEGRQATSSRPAQRLCPTWIRRWRSDLELPHVAVPSDGRKATACYVFTRWRYTAGPAWSRPGVLARDGHRCGYCGGPASTVDHILPRSRGGRNTWTNTIAACDGCNQRKDGRTPPRRA